MSATPAADLLARLARELDAETDLDKMLLRVVEATLTEIGGGEHAGVTPYRSALGEYARCHE